MKSILILFLRHKSFIYSIVFWKVKEVGMHVFNLVSRFTPNKCQLDLEKMKSQILWGMWLYGGSEHSSRRKNKLASLCVIKWYRSRDRDECYFITMSAKDNYMLAFNIGTLWYMNFGQVYLKIKISHTNNSVCDTLMCLSPGSGTLKCVLPQFKYFAGLELPEILLPFVSPVVRLKVCTTELGINLVLFILSSSCIIYAHTKHSVE